MEFATTLPSRHDPFRKIFELSMGKARDFKRHADSVLEELFLSLFEEIDTEKLRKEVDDLKAGAPDYSRSDHARTLTRRTAIRCAAAGAVTGLPSGIIAFTMIGADLAYLMFQQFRLILGIATIYGHEPTSRERFSEALSCLAFTGGAGVGKQGIAAMLGAATTEGGVIAERIGTRLLRDRMAKVVPFVGAISGGALNFFAVNVVARNAIRYYESRIDPGLAEEIWAEGDREHA
ncbi:MAG TPA: EcsC family protein [Thermoanaerobaculia bacterium]